MARFKDVARSEGGTVTEQISYPPWKIQVEPGYNPRDMDSPEVQEYVRGWAEKILSGGWNPSFPFLIRWDGKIAKMREGHCRQQGIALAADPAYRAAFEERTGLTAALPIELVKCDLTPAATNEVDDLYIPLSSQEKLSLTPDGWIEQIQKLVRAGQSHQMIVRRLGQTAQRMIELAEAPTEVRAATLDKKISPTLAINTLREHGAKEGAAVIKAAIEEGGGRARPRHVREVVEREEKPRTEPPSLCSLATKTILTWDAWIAVVDISVVDPVLMDAIEAMRERIGMAAMDAAKIREAA